MRVDRHASVIAAGEIAHLSYDAHLSTDSKGRPESLRVQRLPLGPRRRPARPARCHPFRRRRRPGPVTAGWSAARAAAALEVTNRPLVQSGGVRPNALRRRSARPAGTPSFIATENYSHLAARTARNAMLFEDVPLLYGDNRFEIILYGPQGQQRSRLEDRSTSARARCRPARPGIGRASTSRASNLLGNFVDRDDGGGLIDDRPGDFTRPDLQAAIQVEHGLDKRTSVGLLAAMLLADNEKLTFVEGSVRRSIGPALVEAAVARDGQGGMAGAGAGGRPPRLDQRQRRGAAGQRFRHQRASARSAIATPGCRSMRRSRSAASTSPRMATCAWSIAAGSRSDAQRRRPPVDQFQRLQPHHLGQLAAAPGHATVLRQPTCWKLG